MSRLAAKDSHEKRPFKPQIYKNRGQNRSFGQGSYQNSSNSRNRGQFTNIDPDRTTETAILEGTLEDMVDKITEEAIEMIDIMTTIETGTDQDKEHLQEITAVAEDISSSNIRSRSGSRANTNRDRIRCYKCREYDHFARDCPSSREERDLEQLQQMLNMEEQNHRIESSDGDYKSPLNV